MTTVTLTLNPEDMKLIHEALTTAAYYLQKGPHARGHEGMAQQRAYKMRELNTLIAHQR
jgi:hypothetical protein